MRSRLTRWRGLVGVGWRRVHHRLGRSGNRQTLVCVLGIALPVALLLLVVSVSLGLAADPATGADANYWLVPEGATSAVTSVGGAQLADVHTTSTQLRDREDIAHVSPVLLDFAVADSPAIDRTNVLVVGVIPGSDHPRIAPLPTDGLQPGDPYFDNGSYEGEWTGQAVVSESAAAELNRSNGDAFQIRGLKNNFTITAVEPPETAGLTQLPIVIVHLSELQELTGAAEQDSADQLVVVAPDATAATEQRLDTTYPQTSVETRGGLLTQRGTESDLPAAISLAALLIAVVTGTLLVSTAFGFELAADSQKRQVLSALGVAGRSRAGIVGAELGVMSLYGGALGVGIWAVVGIAMNQAAIARFDAPVASMDPRFVFYGIAAATTIGLLSLPYLLIVSYRSGGEVSLR